MLFINNYIYLFAEIFFGIGILLLMCFGLIKYDINVNGKKIALNNISLVIKIAYWIIVLTLILYIFQFYTLYINIEFFVVDPKFYIFDNTFVISPSILAFKILILIALFFYLMIVQLFYKEEKIIKFEFIILLLLATYGFMFLISANNFLIFYLALEFQSIVLYILCSFKQRINAVIESGLKLFIIGSFISGILLFGISWIYGALGTIQFNEIQILMLNNSPNILLITGFIFVIVSMFFKLAIVPFHLWLSDIYLGAPTLTVCYIATIPKIAVGFVFFRIIKEIFIFTNFFIIEITYLFTFLGLLTIIIGMLGAVFQNKIKSFIAYSSISNMGYYLLIVSMLNVNNMYTLYVLFLFFLFYSFTLFCIFIILLSLRYNNIARFGNENVDDNVVNLSELSGLSKINLGLSITFAFTLFSLMSIPPFVGFFIKYLITVGLIGAQLYYVAFVLIFMGVLSVYYYLRIIKLLFFDKINLTLFLKPISFFTYLYIYSLSFILLLIFLKPMWFLLIFNLII